MEARTKGFPGNERFHGLERFSTRPTWQVGQDRQDFISHGPKLVIKLTPGPQSADKDCIGPLCMESQKDAGPSVVKWTELQQCSAVWNVFEATACIFTTIGFHW